MSKKWKTSATPWDIYGNKGSAVLAWRLKMQALLETRDLECFVILLSPWESEGSRTFSKKPQLIEQEQVVNY